MSDPGFPAGPGQDEGRPMRVEQATQPPMVDATMMLGALSTATDPDAEAAASGPSGADQQAIEALPVGSALLIAQRGANAGARFLLDKAVTTAGRKQDSDIFLDDVTVSRRHAEFVHREGAFVVRDVGSLNGTYVGGDRIDEIVLRAGDEVQIGKYRLVYHPSPRGV